MGRYVDSVANYKIFAVVAAFTRFCRKRRVPYRKHSSKSTESVYIEIDFYTASGVEIYLFRFSTHDISTRSRWEPDYDIRDFKDFQVVRRDFLKKKFPKF
jgi:hypothetical protein